MIAVIITCLIGGLMLSYGLELNIIDSILFCLALQGISAIVSSIMDGW